MHILFYILGLLLLIVGGNYEVGVSVGGGGIYDLPREVANTQKLQIQMMIWQAGLASIIAGAILTPRGNPVAVDRPAENRFVEEMDEHERELRREGVRRLNRNIGIFLGLLFIGIITLLAYIE